MSGRWVRVKVVCRNLFGEDLMESHLPSTTQRRGDLFILFNIIIYIFLIFHKEITLKRETRTRLNIYIFFSFPWKRYLDQKVQQKRFNLAFRAVDGRFYYWQNPRRRGKWIIMSSSASKRFARHARIILFSKKPCNILEYKY